MESEQFRARLLQLLPAGSYRRLLIELTETAEIEDIPTAAATLQRLREQNIGVCLDDFGAGAAAFRYLRDFPVDYLKIDGAYVQGALRGERERNVVTSMLELARSVGAETIAEAIETRGAGPADGTTGLHVRAGLAVRQGGPAAGSVVRLRTRSSKPDVKMVAGVGADPRTRFTVVTYGGRLPATVLCAIRKVLGGGPSPIVTDCVGREPVSAPIGISPPTLAEGDINFGIGAGRDSVHHGRYLSELQAYLRPFGAACQDDDRKLPTGEVLLISDPSVCRYQEVKTRILRGA